MMHHSAPGPASVIWTIGHSNHALETFLALLAQQWIEWVADVRSYLQEDPTWALGK
jgi:hypothetical protein